ncbi:MAG: ribonuclease H-like domain-containing protein, partial [Halodesulfurarchaeum sp.]
MEGTPTVRMAVAAPTVVLEATDAQLADWRDIHEPDVTLLAGEGSAPMAVRRLTGVLEWPGPVWPLGEPGSGTESTGPIPAGATDGSRRSRTPDDAAEPDGSEDAESGGGAVESAGGAAESVGGSVKSTGGAAEPVGGSAESRGGAVASTGGRGNFQFLRVPDRAALRGLPEAVEGLDGEGEDSTLVVLTGALALDIDTTSLTTTLVGSDFLRTALREADGQWGAVVATGLPEGFRDCIDGVPLVGTGGAADEDEPALHAVDVDALGRVQTRSVSPDSLGLVALDGVGEHRAAQLRDAGLANRAAVATATTRELVDLEGIGETTARRLQQRARAVERGQIVHTGTDPLPDGEPVFIDIETDGLRPTITWLVGVLDGYPGEGRYLSFCNRDPDDPARAVADFLTWFDANAADRPLVAYAGWSFDFQVLRDHALEYCPALESVIVDAFRFDPYRWAIEEGNAILPGVTNRLSDVAEAL